MEKKLITKERVYDLNKNTLVMGIVNVTPDSFSDGGRYQSKQAAVAHAQQLLSEGADILDIGGESTRPGHAPVSIEEELERVVPIIEEIRKITDAPISIDTYKAEVAKQAISAGASIINDVWGAKWDPNMAEVAASSDVPIILMHNRHDKNYSNIVEDMIIDLEESVSIVKNAGVKDDKIILDPGVGFAKTMEDNLVVMRELDRLTGAFPYPFLLATSRKRFIGYVLDLPVEERMEGTGATVCLGIQKGCQIVRVHDVQPIKRMVKMMDAMLGKGSL